MTSTTPILDTVEHAPDGAAQASVIWLHGLGADGNDFASLPPQLGVSPDLAVRYVFPHAPVIPVTINMGTPMPAWYDITSLDARGQDEAGIRQSAASIEMLIAREIDRGWAQIDRTNLTEDGLIHLIELSVLSDQMVEIRLIR